MTGGKVLCLRDIERLNIFDFLFPYEIKIRDIYYREGTAAARRYVYRVLNIRMRGWEIRKFLSMEVDEGALLAREAHREAWSSAGWNGSYSPLGYMPGDDKKTDLLAAGLMENGRKVVCFR